VDRVQQGFASAQQYLGPPEEPKSIEIGDYVQATVRDLLGKCGMVLWTAGNFVLFQDNDDLLKSDDNSE
jgi:hypothetical protein